MILRLSALLATTILLSAPAGSGLAQTGAATARPYTQADLDYGRALKPKIDAARASVSEAAAARAAVEPFRIVGDTWYAGVRGHGVYVIRTSEGVIMIDNGWGDTATKVEASLTKLGISLTDIKIMLLTENHGDHAGATAYFKAKSGAQLFVMEGDVDGLQNRPTNPIKVDRVLRDRDTVTLGGKTLTAYHIPGHSAGSTTWYWQEREGGQTYNVASVCCWTTPANVVSNPDFPAERLARNFETLKSLPVDIPSFGPTVDTFDWLGKMERIAAGEDRLKVFVDPQGYRGVAALYAQAFEEKLARQRREGPPPPPAPAAPTATAAPAAPAT
jgi:metallo-beta-lactamase class B